jgi:hypothetical protein
VDQKFSDMGVSPTIKAADLIPIVTDGNNKVVTAGVFSLNLPNFGNSGITKNAPVSPTGAAISLLNTLVAIGVPSTYTLASGLQGQEIVIVNKTVQTTTLVFSGQTATILSKGSISLIFVDTEWYVKSLYNCTVA